MVKDAYFTRCFSLSQLVSHSFGLYYANGQKQRQERKEKELLAVAAAGGQVVLPHQK